MFIFKDAKKPKNVIIVNLVKNLISSWFHKKLDKACLSGHLMVQTICRTLERYIVDKEIVLATNTFIRHQLPLLTSTRHLVTGIITAKTCFQPWTWVTVKNLSFVQWTSTPHRGLRKHHVHSYRTADPNCWNRYDAPLQKSGALTGLAKRVREMSLNDTATFVTPGANPRRIQTLQLIIDVYEDFNLTDYRFRLSYRDQVLQWC